MQFMFILNPVCLYTNMKTLSMVQYFNRSWRSISRNKLSGNIKYTNNITRTISTIDSKKIELFTTWDTVDYWWHPKKSPIRGLQLYNPVRTQLVKDGLVNAGVIKIGNSDLPLSGIKIVDVGCGGGVMSEALAKAGAQVTGIDVTPVLIKVAKEHLKLNPDISEKVNYVHTTVADFVQNEGENSTYDAIVLSEVLQHVANPKVFLKDCVKILKPGKSIFITTPNRTLLTLLYTKIGAEYIFRSIPRNTLKWSNFVTPHELQRILKDYGCETKLIRGIKFNPLTRKWTWWSKTYNFYGLHAIKQKEIYI